MVARVSYDCDNCGKARADRLTLDLGGGKRMIDLCSRCARDHNLPVMEELLAEYGVQPVENGRAVKTVKAVRVGVMPRSGHAGGANIPAQCPVCDRTLSSRNYAIKHCVDQHGMDRPAASRAILPSGRGKVCPHCDELLDERGYSAHQNRHHPDAAPVADTLL